MKTLNKDSDRLVSVDRHRIHGWLIEVVIDGIALWIGYFRLIAEDVGNKQQSQGVLGKASSTYCPVPLRGFSLRVPLSHYFFRLS